MTWKGAKPRNKEDLTTLDNEELFSRVKSDDRCVQDLSRRVLIERKKQAIPLLQQWAEKTGNAFELLQVIWLQQAMDAVDTTQLQSLVVCNDPRVRAAAIRIVSDLADPETDLANPLARALAMLIYQKAINDEHPRVRLEAIRGLGKLNSAEAARIALESLNHPRDRFIDFALATTMDELTVPFMAALDSGQW